MILMVRQKTPEAPREIIDVSGYHKMLRESLDSLDAANEFNRNGWAARRIYKDGFVIQMPGTKDFRYVTYARHWGTDSIVTVEKHYGGSLVKPSFLVGKDHKIGAYAFSRFLDRIPEFREAVRHVHDLTEDLRTEQAMGE